MYTFTGCSGYHYDHWREQFYPAELSKKEWLPYYAEHFKTVEINNTFYGLPDKKKVANWHEITPGNFRFTMKGSRYITHTKKLVNDNKVKSGVKRFYEAIEPIGGKLGCILWQLPGNLHRNDEKLEKFCSLLSTDFKNVMEFRHESWFTEPIYDILKKHKVGYCILSAPGGLPEGIHTPTDTAYVRFHGKDNWYDYHYSEKELEEWRDKLDNVSVRRVYLYFNNDAHGYAPENAKQMKELLNEK